MSIHTLSKLGAPLIPETAYRVHHAVRQAAQSAQRESFIQVHFTATLYAVKALAYSFFNTWGYFFEGIGYFSLLVCQLHVREGIKVLGKEWIASGKSCISTAMGVAYVALGFFFPKTVFPYAEKFVPGGNREPSRASSSGVKRKRSVGVVEGYIPKKRALSRSPSSELEACVEEAISNLNKSRLVEEEKAIVADLQYAIVQGAVEEVERALRRQRVLKRQIEPSLLTFHLARSLGQERILHLLDEAFPCFRKEKGVFSAHEFQGLIRYLQEHPVEALELDFSGHPEITDGFFLEGFSLPSLEKLNLFGCTGIADKGLKHILLGCPQLKELKVGAERQYEDLEVLSWGVAPSSDSGLETLEDSFSGRVEYENYQKRQCKLTRKSLEYLAKHAENLERLSFVYCQNLDEGIGDLLAHLSYFSHLTFLDLSDCYGITYETIQRVQKAHTSLEIKKERIFKEASLPSFLLCTEEKVATPTPSRFFTLSPALLNSLYQAILFSDTESALSLLMGREGKQEPSSPGGKFPSTIEEVLNLAAKQGDYVIVHELLQRQVFPKEKTLQLAVCHNKEKEVARLLLDRGIVPSKKLLKWTLEHKEEDLALLLLERFEGSTKELLDIAVCYQYNAYELIAALCEKDSGMTEKTLFLAAEHNHVRIVQLLIEQKAHPTEELLNSAVAQNKRALVEFLLQKGMVPTEETLQQAVKNGLVEMIPLLIEEGACYTEETLALVQASPLAERIRPFFQQSTLSLEDKALFLLKASIEQVKRLIENEAVLTEEMLNRAVQRDSSVVLELLLEKEVTPSILTCKIALFNLSYGLLHKFQRKIPQVSSTSFTIDDASFNELLPYLSEKKELNLQGWYQLSDAAFAPSQQLSRRLPHVLCVDT
eukprot:Opistho-1_new@26570